MEPTKEPGLVQSRTLWSRRNQRSLPIWLALAAGLLLLGRVVALQFPDQGSGKVEWVPLASAERVARGTQRRIFYDFSAEWCGPCQEMERTVFREAEITARLNEDFIPVRIVDRRREEGKNRADVDALQRKYSIQAYPTLLITTADGKELGRMVGYRGRSSFRKFLQDY